LLIVVVIGHNPLENQVSKTSFSASHSPAGNGGFAPTRTSPVFL